MALTIHSSYHPVHVVHGPAGECLHQVVVPITPESDVRGPLHLPGPETQLDYVVVQCLDGGQSGGAGSTADPEHQKPSLRTAPVATRARAKMPCKNKERTVIKSKECLLDV